MKRLIAKGALLLALAGTAAAEEQRFESLAQVDARAQVLAQREDWRGLEQLIEEVDCEELVPEATARFWDTVISATRNNTHERAFAHVPVLGETKDITIASMIDKVYYDVRLVLDAGIAFGEVWQIHSHPLSTDEYLLEEIGGLAPEGALIYTRTISDFQATIPSPKDIHTLAINSGILYEADPDAQLRQFIIYDDGKPRFLEYKLTRKATSELQDILKRTQKTPSWRQIELIAWELRIKRDYSLQLDVYMDQAAWSTIDGFPTYSADTNDFISHINEQSRYIRLENYPSGFGEYICLERRYPFQYQFDTYPEANP